jgi:hypothetical protein
LWKRIFVPVKSSAIEVAGAALRASASDTMIEEERD